MAGRARHSAVLGLVVALLASACVLAAATTVPGGGTAGASSSPQPQALTGAPSVTLQIQLLVGPPSDPVQVVGSDALTALDTKLLGVGGSDAPSPSDSGTPLGALSIDYGSNTGVTRVTVTGDFNGPDVAGKLAYQWSLTASPPGSKAALSNADSSTPAIKPDLPGTYGVTATVRDDPGKATAATSSTERVAISAVPNDPPLGVPIHTVASESGAISVNGVVAKDTGVTNTMSWAVINRADRALVDGYSGTVPADTGGLSQLAHKADQLKGANNYLMVVNSPASSKPISDYAALFTALGVGPLSDQSKVELGEGRSFSLIGIPGGQPGGAWMAFGSTVGSGPRQASDLSGQIQLNPATSTYQFLPTSYPVFDTRAAGSSATTNVVQVGGFPAYQVSVPTGQSGFQIVALDPTSLALLPNGNRVFATNGSGSDGANEEAMANYLRVLANQVPMPVVMVQSIGQPAPVGPAWAKIANQLVRFGATAAIFNAVSSANAAPSYAFVGRGESGTLAERSAPSAEAARNAGANGALAGDLYRTRTDLFSPMLADPPDKFGNPNTELVSIAYQQPTPWPSFDPSHPDSPITPQETAAMDWIGKHKLQLCKTDDPAPCNVRHAYYEDYNSNSWATWLTILGDLKNHCPDGTGTDGTTTVAFTSAVCKNVAAELFDEVGMRNRVAGYIDSLKQPFSDIQTRSQVDVQTIGNDIVEDLRPPPEEVGPNGVQIARFVSNVFKLGFDIAGEKNLKFFLEAVGIALYLVGTYVGKNTAPTFDSQIRATVSYLSTAVLDRFDTAKKEFNAIGQLIVSDYGKMKAAAAKVDTDWKPPDPAVKEAALRTAVKAFYYQTLVPVAYPNLFRADKTVGPPNTAGEITCGSAKPWNDGEPPTAQDNQTTDFAANGTPISPVVFIRKNGRYLWGDPPSGEILAPLFEKSGPDLPGLGLNKAQFYSIVNWPRGKTVKVGADLCGLTGG